MRKIKAFSASLQYSRDSRVKVFNDTESAPRRTAEVNSNAGSNGLVKVFMTKSMIDMQIREMKKSINIRFSQLIRASKTYTKSVRDPEDMMYLKKFLTLQLTNMLSDYVDMLDGNASLQLQTYLKINSVMPSASDSAKVLSRIMIKCNKVRRTRGALPIINQRELNRAMNDFISTIIDGVTGNLNVNDPIILDVDAD